LSDAVRVTIELGNLADWAAAIGTVGALWAVLRQMRRDRLRHEGLESKDREHTQRRYAERVSAWPGEDDGAKGRLFILNRSEEPVYQMLVTLVHVQGAAPRKGEDFRDPEDARNYRAMLSVLPPGEWSVEIEGAWGILSGRPGVEIGFTDSAGTHWVRRASGQLEELPQSAFDYFGLHRPLDLRMPDSA
jgi:hypothetical protein